MLEAVHLLHVLAGVIWAGGAVIYAVVVFPAMAAQPGAEAGRLWQRMLPVVGPVMGGTAVLALVTGLVQAWLSGRLASWADVATAGGISVLVAVALWVAIQGVEGTFRARFRRLMDTAAFEAEAPSLARRSGWVVAALTLALILLMGAMGMGLA